MNFNDLIKILPFQICLQFAENVDDWYNLCLVLSNLNRYHSLCKYHKIIIDYYTVIKKSDIEVMYEIKGRVENRLHREDDLPAIEYINGTKYWYKNGKLHRENDLPAVEYNNGTKEWYKNGKQHRDNDLPAVEYNDGRKYWYKNGESYEFLDKNKEK